MNDLAHLPGDLKELLIAENWSYLAEGNRNLVARFFDASCSAQNALNRIVLRVPKYHDGDSPSGSSEKELRDGLRFDELLVSQLLGLEKCHAPRLPISLSNNFLEALELRFDGPRPEERKIGRLGRLGETRTWATLAADHLTLPGSRSVLAVEIKPKLGFLPFSNREGSLSKAPFIIKDEAETKRTTCRYCMHSFLRHSKLPLYCPMDLYSGDRTRVLKGLRGLAKAAGEDQGFNNYRVSFEGRQLGPEEIKGLFTDRGNAMWTDFYGSPVEDDSAETYLELIATIIEQSGVLDALRKHQTLLAPLDITAIYALYSNLLGNGETIAEPDFESELNRYYNESDQERTKWAGLSELELLGLPVAEKKAALARFASSMVLRDVSVLIAVGRTSESDNSSNDLAPNSALHSLVDSDTSSLFDLEHKGIGFQATVRIVDADPKSLKKIPGWYELDRRIVGNWMGRTEKVDRVCRLE
jgi:inositol-pentakisphosphate 2-kinase